MSVRLLRGLLALLVPLLSGCSTSTGELPATVAELRVEVEAEDFTNRTFGRNDSHQSLRVVLRNGEGAAIEREDVRVEANGMPMRFRVGRGNYYDRHPYYLLDAEDSLQLAPSREFRIVLFMPDSTRHEAGTLRMPAALSPAQFEFAPQAPTSGPVTFGWRDLVEPVQLRIGRAEERREADGTVVTEGAGPFDPNALRRTIGPGFLRRATDRWVLPREYLVSTADRKLLWLLAEVVVTSEGRATRAVSRASTLVATRRLQFLMEFAKSD